MILVEMLAWSFLATGDSSASFFDAPTLHLESSPLTELLCDLADVCFYSIAINFAILLTKMCDLLQIDESCRNHEF
jgi:hypothetical protein